MSGRFGSLITAMVTPFRDDHAIDIDGAERLAAHLLDTGSRRHRGGRLHG